MKRWHEDYFITRRQWLRHRKTHIVDNMSRSQGNGDGQAKPGSDPEAVSCPCDNQIGRFRKMDAFDCGKPRCQVCHCYGLKAADLNDPLADLNFKEQLQEWLQDGQRCTTITA